MMLAASGVRTMLSGLLIATAGMCWSASAAPVRDERSISLVDQSGAPFHLADLRGRRTLVTFVATRCTDVCPIANVMFRRIERRLQRDRADVRLLTLTLDPEYDTPFVMAHVARELSAEPHEWTFASGRPSDMHRIMRAFGVAAEQRASGAPEVHSTFVYVLDENVRLARTLLLSTGLADAVEQALHVPASNGALARRTRSEGR